MTRWQRILAVTAGLAVAGAIVGAIAGAAALAIWGLFVQGPPSGAVGNGFGSFLAAGAGIGALFGVVLGPAAAWLLMRTVPLGRALFGTAVGTVIGGVAGLALGLNPIAMPVAGFLAAALALRVTAGRGGKKKAIAPPSDADDAV